MFAIYRLLDYLKLQVMGKIWLILASFYFYAQGAKDFLPFFIGTVFFNYIIGSTLVLTKDLKNRRVLLALGLVQNIGLLGYFKYANFFVQNYNILTGSDISIGEIVLPIGISFFTFQLIAYLIDCYRGETKEYSVVDYLLFITFFPQLIVGPIVHHKDVVPQFEFEKQSIFSLEKFLLGLFIFSIGAAKKVMIADPLTSYGKLFFANVSEYGLLDAWLSTFAYTFSYYFDLSGYADMAIGMGYLFNIKLPENFNSPYKARNFREYWRRWHMTLSKFLSDYIFRSVYKKGDKSLKFYFAIIVTFLVSGFWHGAGWQFIVWGIVNGIFVSMAHFMYRKGWSLPLYLAWLLTFAGVLGTRVLFVSKGLKGALRSYEKLFSFSSFIELNRGNILFETGKFLAYNSYTLLILIVAMGIAFFAKNTMEIAENFTLKYRYAFAIGVLLAITLVQMTVVSDFLYFQF